MNKSNEDLCEEHNFLSEKFNPKKVLSSNIVSLPVENAKLFNNLDEYASKSFPKSRIQKEQDPILKEQERIRKKMLELIKPVERTKKWISPKTVLTLMNTKTDLSCFLNNYLGKKIHIFMRRRRKCNHFFEQFIDLFGQLLFYDKHWNLILSDVQENVKTLNNVSYKDITTDKSKFFIRERFFSSLFIRGDNIIHISSI